MLRGKENIHRLSRGPAPPCSVPITHIAAYNSSSGGPDALCWPPWTLHTHGAHKLTQAHTCVRINNSFFGGEGGREGEQGEGRKQKKKRNDKKLASSN